MVAPFVAYDDFQSTGQSKPKGVAGMRPITTLVVIFALATAVYAAGPASNVALGRKVEQLAMAVEQLQSQVKRQQAVIDELKATAKPRLRLVVLTAGKKKPYQIAVNPDHIRYVCAATGQVAIQWDDIELRPEWMQHTFAETVRIINGETTLDNLSITKK